MRNTIAAVVLSGLSGNASAEWVAGVNYSNYDPDAVDLDLGVLSGSLGYRFDLGEGVLIVPEGRAGFGVVDDSAGGVNVEIDQAYVFTLRGEYDFGNGVYIYVAPSYGYIEATAQGFGVSVTDDTDDFGMGGGAGY